MKSNQAFRLDLGLVWVRFGVDLESIQDPFEVDWVSTAALVISRRAYETAGGLDEDFFVYWVDADWCARVKAANFRILAVPASHIIHDENLKAKRTARKSSRMIKDFHRGAYLYYRKNHATARFHPMALVAWVGLSLRAQLMILADYLRWQYVNLSPKAKGVEHG